MKLIENIQLLLKQKGTNAHHLSESIGVAQSTITRILDGTSSPKLKLAMAIAAYFEITTSELIGEKELPPPSYADEGFIERLDKITVELNEMMIMYHMRR